MLAKDEFPKFLDKLVIQNEEDLLTTYKGVVKKLNQIYWKSDSESDHAVQVGSYGRSTAINGTSDLDLLFILPDELFKQYDEHEGNGQSALLQDVKKALLEKYPGSDITADGQVVSFDHSNYLIEILPCFALKDGTYRHADTNDGGSWEITDPKTEMIEFNNLDTKTKSVLRNLCKMSRAWKNKNGVPMGGFLIDTLGYNFLNNETKYHGAGVDQYPNLCRDFYEFLASQDEDQEYWLAPGSNKRVYRKDKFSAKAKKAKTRCDDAIKNDGKESARVYWKRIFGRPFPNKAVIEKALREFQFKDTEEYIEDRFPINIRESLRINCRVKQDGYREKLLRELHMLKSKYDLEFFVEATSAKKPYTLYWKVLNIGREAEKRDMVRGQIIEDSGNDIRKESSNFKGEHIVEAYIVKNGMVIARDSIPVNIDEY